MNEPSYFDDPPPHGSCARKHSHGSGTPFREYYQQDTAR